jgi:hypothetical protein
MKLIDRIANRLTAMDSRLKVQEAYEHRWVWYHTILVVEIFLTNILLIAILFKL